MPYSPLDSFTRSPATAIVSLGGACSVAYNLRRHFGFETAYPFDWWVTPARSVAALLERPDMGWLFDPSRLKPTEGHDSIRHTELGISLHHDFPRQLGVSGTPVVENYVDFLDDAKSKATLLFARLFDLNRRGQRIVFVREWLGDEDRSDLMPEIERSFPSADWSLLATNPIRGQSWHGDAAGWDAMLRGSGVCLVAPAAPPPGFY